MVSSIKKQLETLVALQETELQITGIEQNLAGIEGRIEALTSEITAYEIRVSEYQTALDELKQQYRADEREVKEIDTHITKSNEKLRDVKTNKEYRSMLKEIDDLKKKQSDIEDRMLENLEKIEKSESEMAIQKSDLADAKTEVAAKQDEIRQESERHRRALADLNQERNGIWESVDPKLQTLYNRVKQQGRGIAVAAVADAVCQVCRMNIPPQQYNELQRMDSMRMCPNCQRIIYPKVLLEKD